MKTVFVNPEHCIGCRQCEFACAVEHSASRDPVRSTWEDPRPVPRIHVEPGPWLNSSFPNKCRHCDPAPCQQICPTAAIYRDADHDVVMVAADKCIACAMCAMVCPFDVITFHANSHAMPARLVATKCDGCIDRLRRGDEPACAETCKVEALVFGDLNELIRTGRMRDSVVAITATTALDPAHARTPDTVAGWRHWGEEATHVAEGAPHDHSPSH